RSRAGHRRRHPRGALRADAGRRRPGARSGRSGRPGRSCLARDSLPHADGKEPARLMDLVPVMAMVRKDLRLFLSDRRSVIVSFIVPIAIASFFGSIIGSNNREPAPIAMGLVDEDGSTISKGLSAGVQGDK